MDRSSGSESVTVVEFDVLDHEIKFVGAVDLPGDAVIVVWRDHAGAMCSGPHFLDRKTTLS